MNRTISSPRDYLFDVSRLVWRYWTRRLPTGIDRVCLAYLAHYRARAQAVLQRGRYRVVLSPARSDALFDVLLAPRSPSRLAMMRRLLPAVVDLPRAAHRSGQLYLNVGHTGLNEPGLPTWVHGNALRAIYLVHDLIPLTHPQFCRAGEPSKHESRMRNVLDSAAGVIGNSQDTLDSLRDFATSRGLAMPPTVAAWIGGSAAPLQASGPPPLATPYFLTVGTIEGRKNHLLLLDIWQSLVAELGASAPALVVIGQRGWMADAAIALLDRPGRFRGTLIERNHCSDAELARWMHGARALLMPSFAEGFGLPVIEALQAGTPVIASDLAIFREIAGDIPTYVGVDQRAEWTRWIKAFAGDHVERLRQIEAMKSYRAPDWQQHFHIVDRWLASL